MGRHSKFQNIRLQERLEKIKSILIICGAKRTEPNYFKGLKSANKLPNITIHVSSIVKDPLGIIETLERNFSYSKYDEIWCVVDKDEFQILPAIKKANKSNLNIKVVYSNQCFELWLLLHYEKITSSITKKSYMKKLSNHLGKKYTKNKINIYSVMEIHQEKAIKNAQSLLVYWKKYFQLNPDRNDPSTTVHLLVTRLLDKQKGAKQRAP